MRYILHGFFGKKAKFLLFTSIALGGFFLLTAPGYAAEQTLQFKPEDMETIVKVFNSVATVAAALMGMVTSFITLFLYPGWVNGDLFGLADYLKKMWILVSNVVYFIFAFLMIAIAFMNIIGKGDGNWALKQAMPRLILGILFVPFSWFVVQFILSISSVLTVAVLTLPYDSFKSETLLTTALDNELFSAENLCADLVVSFNGDFTGVDVESGGVTGNAQTDAQMGQYMKCKKDGRISMKELLTGVNRDGGASAKAGQLQNSIYGVISLYSYGILQIQELDTISRADLSAIKSVADLVLKIVFDLLFVVVYLLLMIALLLALFSRGVRLWVFAMLSPVFGLLYFLGKESDGFGEAGSGMKFSIKEFIHLALIPVYVSAALSFGLIFTLVASEGIKTITDNKDEIKAGGFSLTIIGAHGNGAVEEQSVIGKLVVEIFGVVILWVGVMFALSKSETTAAVIEPIAQFGKSVGQLAVKAPTYAPILPQSLGGSVEGFSRMGKMITSAPDQIISRNAGDAAKPFLQSMGADTSSIDIQRNAATLKNAVQSGWRNANDELKALVEGRNMREISANSDAVGAINDLLAKADIKDVTAKQNDRRSIADALYKLSEKFPNDEWFKGYKSNYLGVGTGNIDAADLYLKGESPSAPEAGGAAASPTNQTNIQMTYNGTTTTGVDVSKLNFTGTGNSMTATGDAINDIKTAIGQTNINQGNISLIKDAIKNLKLPDASGNLKDLSQEQIDSILRALSLNP